MYYKNFLIILTSLLILSGCLQNPAPIDGINNYYTNSDKYKKQQYRQIESECVDNQVFADEKMTKNKVFDPYQLPPVENLIEEENQLANSNDVIKDFKVDEKKSDLDWNNIFNEVKEQKIENKENTSQLQAIPPKKEIKKIENNNNTLKKPATKVIESNKPLAKKPTLATSVVQNTATNDVAKKEEKKLQQALIIKPTSGKILTKYGQSQNSELDDGMTFSVSDKTIKSSGDGKIIYIDGENSSHKTIIVKHNNGIISSYSYNGDIKTSINKEIKAGQIIGEVGNENNILYFTVRQNGKTIDPEKIMK